MTIQIVCEHLASVPGPEGQRHHIAFNPTPETVDAAYAWKDSGARHSIEVEDRAGLHERRATAAVVKLVYDYGTLCITTDA